MADPQLSEWLKAVVFDLDGTLFDSAPDIGLVLNKVLEEDGHGPFSLQEVRSFIGHGIKRLVERAYEARKAPLSGKALDDKVEDYLGIYMRNIAVETKAYPGALDLVATLRGQGVRTGICTNKTDALSHALVEALNVGSMFDVIIGGQPSLPAKPAADMLLETLRRLECSPGEAVMVGDSVSDVECARAAKVRFVGVTFGYTDKPMRELGPDAAIDHFSQGMEAIAGLRELA